MIEYHKREEKHAERRKNDTATRVLPLLLISF